MDLKKEDGEAFVDDKLIRDLQVIKGEMERSEDSQIKVLEPPENPSDGLSNCILPSSDCTPHSDCTTFNSQIIQNLIGAIKSAVPPPAAGQSAQTKHPRTPSGNAIPIPNQSPPPPPPPPLPPTPAAVASSAPTYKPPATAALPQPATVAAAAAATFLLPLELQDLGRQMRAIMMKPGTEDSLLALIGGVHVQEEAASGVPLNDDGHPASPQDVAAAGAPSETPFEKVQVQTPTGSPLLEEDPSPSAVMTPSPQPMTNQ